MQSESAPTTPAPVGPAEADALLDPQVFRPLPKRDPRLAFRLAVVGAGLALAVIGGGVYIYRNFFYADFSPSLSSPVPGREDRARATADSAGTGALGPNAEGQIQAQPAASQGAVAAPQTEKALSRASSLAAPSAPPAATPPPRGNEARRTAIQATPSKPAATGSAATKPATIKPAVVSTGSCTQALAAMGLCTPTAPRRATVSRGPATGQAATPAPADCKEGVAALGLCTTSSGQRKE